MASVAVYPTTDATVWHAWNATITTNCQPVWDTWTTSSTTTYAVQNIVWTTWVEGEATRDEVQARVDELQARREQASRERLASLQAQEQNREAASARAIDLFHDLLTEDERACLDEHGYLIIEGQDGNRYRLEANRATVHGNIVRIDARDRSLGRACVAPQMLADGQALPTADGWVGQYLGLKYDTWEFLSHANWSFLRTYEDAA